MKLLQGVALAASLLGLLNAADGTSLRATTMGQLDQKIRESPFEKLDAASAAMDKQEEALDAASAAMDKQEEALDAASAAMGEKGKALDAASAAMDKQGEALDKQGEALDNSTKAMEEFMKNHPDKVLTIDGGAITFGGN